MKDHCENCGSTDPADLTTGDGYTSCCNELICDGYGSDRYGTDALNVRACCWAVAEQQFADRGIEVPEGSSRLR